MKLRNLKLPKPVHWLIYTAGVLLVLGAIILGLASTPWFRSVLQHRIKADLENVTGGKVEITGMKFQPLDLRVSARRVTIRGLEKDPKEPLLSAQDVVATASPKTLTQFRLVLRTLEWHRAELHVRTYPDGSTNVPGPKAAPAERHPVVGLLNLGIERLTLSNTTLNWNDQRIPFQAKARDVAIQIHLTHGQHYLAAIASSGAAFHWKGNSLPPVSFATTLEFSQNHAKVMGLTWQIENLRGHLAGDFHWTPRLAGKFEFRTSGGLEALARALKTTPVESGYLFMDGKGSYGSHGLSVSGRMRARDLRLKIPEIKSGVVNIATDYKWAENRLRIPNFTLSGLKARAQGSATVMLAKERPVVSLRSRFKGLNLSTLMKVVPRSQNTLGIFHPHALISGTLDADWRQPSRLQSRFELQFNPPPAPAPSGLPLSGHAQGSFDVGRETLLTLQDARISTPHSTITSHGTLGTTDSSLAIKVVTTDFEEWRPGAKVLIQTPMPLPITLHSQAVFDGTVTGTFSNPEIKGQISAGTFNYGGWVWDSVQASILASPQQARIRAGRLDLGKSSLVVNAEIGLTDWKVEPYSQVQLQAEAQQTPVAGLRAALNLKPSMKGTLSGTIQAEGTVESLSGHGRVTMRKGEFAGFPFDSLSADILATKSNWEVNNFKVVEEQGRADGRMQVNPVKRTFSANLHGRDFPLERFHFFKPQVAESKSKEEVSGLVSFNLQGGGSFDNARLQSSLDVTSLKWKGKALGSVHGTAQWQGRQINLQIKGGGGQAGNFQINGNMETRDNWPLHISGQYSDFRADPWIEEFAGHAMAAEISASGSFTIEGPLKERNRLAGHSQIRQLQIKFPALQLLNQEPVEISYADRKLQLKSFRLKGNSTNFEVGGSVHLGHPASMDISATGTASATLLSLVANDVQATGDAELQVRMQGSLAEPRLSGNIQVNDVGIGYTGLPVRLNALNGTIRLEGERAVISSLKGKSGGGNVNLAGFFVLQEVPRYQVRADLSEVRVRYPADFTSVLDGRLTLAGTPEQGQLNGNISVRNLFANENLSLIDFLSGPNLLGGPAVAHPSSFASKVNLNVRLASIRPVRIETHNLRLVSDVDLHLQGTLANPVAVGNIYLRSGSAIFRGNRYTLARGDISMSNPFRTEPVLDLQVNTTIDKYDLTLEVSGPTDQIRLSYRSDPPLPTQDILSLLAFGYSKRLEEFAPEARNPFSTASASALLSQALSSQVTGRIQRLFGVSRIKFSPTSTELGTLGGPVLTVEQQLSPKLTLTYETSTANSQYRVIEFEYTVNPRMAVRGFRDQNGIFGLELKFRKRFK